MYMFFPPEFFILARASMFQSVEVQAVDWQRHSWTAILILFYSFSITTFSNRTAPWIKKLFQTPATTWSLAVRLNSLASCQILNKKELRVAKAQNYLAILGSPDTHFGFGSGCSVAGVAPFAARLVFLLLKHSKYPFFIIFSTSNF